jgi:hypothetical protein
MNETSMAARAVANGGRNISRSLDCFASSETSKIYRQSRRKAAISFRQTGRRAVCRQTGSNLSWPGINNGKSASRQQYNGHR